MMMMTIGHCPSDWIEYQGRCYQLMGDDVRKNWTSARVYCIEQVRIVIVNWSQYQYGQGRLNK